MCLNSAVSGERVYRAGRMGITTNFSDTVGVISLQQWRVGAIHIVITIGSFVKHLVCGVSKR